MSPITIHHVISSQAEYNERSSHVMNQQSPPVPDELKKKYRWIQGVVRNATDFDLNVSQTYLDSGHFDQGPSFLGSFNLGAFTGSNGENTIFTGITGGLCYKIDLDENIQWYFSLGFTNPTLGARKAGVVASSNAKDGYETATSEGGTIDSELYEAKCTDGKTVRFKLRVQASAGETMSYSVTMVRFSE